MDGIVIAVIVVSVVGLVCGVVLALASHFMDVPVDERFSKARECLPGANCGACGFTGCDGYAKALADGETTSSNLCVPGGDVVAKNLSKALGLTFEDVEEKVAYVHCNGNCDRSKDRAHYDGIGDCRSANLIYGGPEGCIYGCLGFGDCAQACPEQAICMDDGIARIDVRKCIGCGICVRTCPKHIISLLNVTSKTVVQCSSKEKGALTRKACINGCIGCKKCELNCPEKAIKVVDNLATIDYSLCNGCGKCIELCPIGCLKPGHLEMSHGAQQAL
ncbi:MAG: RnfABCDGE type electron transport complex subunit B [Lachnospiraceae bacterium]|nr:RnfABCDGE type electron transport complex subunit B [Lachnospiraceae bacterium]